METILTGPFWQKEIEFGRPNNMAHPKSGRIAGPVHSTHEHHEPARHQTRLLRHQTRGRWSTKPGTDTSQVVVRGSKGWVDQTYQVQ